MPSFVNLGAYVDEGTMIDTWASVGSCAQVGKNCHISGGAGIGGVLEPLQAGPVIIEDNCDIGANCAIDRATLGSTIIHKGSKLDNLIQVAHNVVIGEKSVIAAQTGIAGSTIIGKNCLIGGHVGFVGHLKIADGTKIGAKTGVSKNVMTPDTIIQGIPAMPIKAYQKFQVGLRGLVKQYFNNKDQSSK